MNYMKKVGGLFGVKIGEEFGVSRFGDGKGTRYKLTEKGLMLYCGEPGWVQTKGVLEGILNGTYTLVRRAKQ